MLPYFPALLFLPVRLFCKLGDGRHNVQKIRATTCSIDDGLAKRGQAGGYPMIIMVMVSPVLQIRDGHHNVQKSLQINRR